MDAAFALGVPDAAGGACSAFEDVESELDDAEALSLEADTALEDYEAAIDEYELDLLDAQEAALGDAPLDLRDAKASQTEAKVLRRETKELQQDAAAATRRGDRLTDIAESKADGLKSDLERLVALYRVEPRAMVVGDSGPYRDLVPLRDKLAETAQVLAEDECDLQESRRLQRELRYHHSPGPI